MKKKSYFSGEMVDRCIYLNDLRGKTISSIHMTKNQATKVGKALMYAGQHANYGKGQNELI